MYRISAGALVLALGMSLLASPQAAAQEQGIRVGSATIAVGESGSVDLESVNIAAPGLAAWSIDVSYDPAVVTAEACSPQQGSVCNPEYAADTVRVTGATAAGLEGAATLAGITFACLAEGTSALTLGSLVFADATVGDPQPIEPAIENGSIQCDAAGAPTATQPAATAGPSPTATQEAPDMAVAGTGPGDLGGGWPPLLIAGLLGAGAAWLIAGGAAAGLVAISAVRARRQGAVRHSGSATEGGTDVPSWLTAAQGRISTAGGATIPTFRTQRERRP